MKKYCPSCGNNKGFKLKIVKETRQLPFGKPFVFKLKYFKCSKCKELVYFNNKNDIIIKKAYTNARNILAKDMITHLKINTGLAYIERSFGITQGTINNKWNKNISESEFALLTLIYAIPSIVEFVDSGYNI